MKARRVAGGPQHADLSGQPAGRFHPCALGRGRAACGAVRNAIRAATSGPADPGLPTRIANEPQTSRLRLALAEAPAARKPSYDAPCGRTQRPEIRGRGSLARATGAPTAAPPRPHPVGPGEAQAALQDHPFSSDTLRPRGIAPPAVTRPDVGTPCGLCALCVSGGLPRSTGTLVPYSGDTLQSSARGDCSVAHPCLTPDLSTGVSTAPQA